MWGKVLVCRCVGKGVSVSVWEEGVSVSVWGEGVSVCGGRC